MILFSEQRAATLDDMSWLRRALRRCLSEIRLLPEVSDDLQLIVAEVVTNVIRHANPPAKNIGIELALTGSTLRLEINDDAAPFEEFGERLERSRRDVGDIGATSGRGMSLVDHAADRIEYLTGDRNRLIAWRGLASRRSTVLIVEDAPLLSQTYAAFLEPHYQVLLAPGVESAMEMAKEVTVDMIVSDYHLDDGDGATIVETFERDPERLPAPVLILTGDRDPAMHKRMMELGVEAVLQKPISASDLVEQVRSAIQRTIRRRTSLFRHFGEASNRLHSTDIASELRGVRIAKRTKAADLGSGDAMIHCSGPDRDRVVLMDLMGHGLAAHAAGIAFAAVVRTVNCANSNCSPGTFLEIIAHSIYSDPALGQLMGTMIVIDILDGGGIEIASAGHPSPVIMAGGNTRLVEIGGPLLGFLPNATYETAQVQLAQGERLLILTDGFDPAPLSSGDPLQPWLSQAIEAGDGIDAEEAVDLLVKRMQHQHGPEPEDDWTVMTFETASD